MYTVCVCVCVYIYAYVLQCLGYDGYNIISIHRTGGAQTRKTFKQSALYEPSSNLSSSQPISVRQPTPQPIYVITYTPPLPVHDQYGSAVPNIHRAQSISKNPAITLHCCRSLHFCLYNLLLLLWLQQIGTRTVLTGVTPPSPNDSGVRAGYDIMLWEN